MSTPLLFSSYQLGQRAPITLSNRVVVAPMCQYSAVNGQATDWHLMHWGNLLNSGAGMFVIEATGVTAEGRITPACLGLWDDATAAALDDKLNRARALAPKTTAVCIQLAHAGRKASSAVPWEGGALIAPEQGGWKTCGPSAIAQRDGEPAPMELTVAQIQAIIESFAQAAKRARAIGIEAIELHAAHGYLMHSFLSPISNQRSDAYGGSFEHRIRFPLEVFKAVRDAFDGVLGIRVSATDWLDHGLQPEEVADFCLRLKPLGCDFVHVSSGGLSLGQKITLSPGYQVPFADLVKKKTGLPTIAVGLITQAQQAEDILQAGSADLIALARGFLFNPRWAWQAAVTLGGTITASPQYWRCAPSGKQAVFGETKMGAR